jgi:hypothetical protein
MPFFVKLRRRGYAPSIRNSRKPSLSVFGRYALLLIGLPFCLYPPLAAAELRPHSLTIRLENI